MRLISSAILFILLLAVFSGCSIWTRYFSEPPEKSIKTTQQLDTHVEQKSETEDKPSVKVTSQKNNDGLPVVANPDSVSVLVNKQYALPDNYAPKDLVYPNVPFLFQNKIEKRQLRKPAAKALEKLFAGAKKDGIDLAGVSGYRSHATQTVLFNNYAKKDGKEKALMYSALPGTSEHETGLSIDVSGIDGKYAATTAFNHTKEAKWLIKHASDYGFIVRYPEGKEKITGYEFEAWHIRYVGVAISKELAKHGWTLEEYYHAVPVSK
ncbi:M15 family metallopeptidase [Terrilactibacillus laevilacticus]|uniref:D-alanyl-D-alanine carboxypeptidase family protein n=1 Tax=Terrilactibacillus laevilacticus TaxID=1380157 RepID=A0ABW5PN98_9BACI|nr:M15 family metallopeptidase [Terrilactibacillus laevilacticus]